MGPLTDWMIERLAPRPGQTILELGAGTGKLTRVLSSLGHDVHATDPDGPVSSAVRGTGR